MNEDRMTPDADSATITKNLTKILEDAFKGFAAGEKFTNMFKAVQAGAGQAPGTKEIVQLLKIAGQEGRKRDKMEVDANRSRLVMLNIMKRAELRELSGQRGMPNIAGLLAGRGGGSVTGHLGRFQKAIEKPFGQAYNYQKQEDAYKKKWGSVGEGWAAMPGQTSMTKEQKEEKAELDEKKKKTMQSLLGKKMGGMVNKVGKFMESGAGQGAMGAGMMGASILTMIIKKAIQASPMMQAMLKIMNTAIMLYLRPIGDFIGGMLRPIALFFMREIAIPALRAGKGMMSMGEQLGKALLGFMLKPIESIQQAIVKSLSQFPLIAGVMGGQAEHWENYDPVKDWLLDRKMDTMIDILTKELDLEKKGIKLSREHIVHAMKGNQFKAGGIYGPTNIQESSKIREEFEKVIKEFQKDDALMSKYGLNPGEMMKDYNMIKAGKIGNVYEELDANIKALTNTNSDGTTKIVTSVDNGATLVAGAISTAITTIAAGAISTAAGTAAAEAAATQAAAVAGTVAGTIVRGNLAPGSLIDYRDYDLTTNQGLAAAQAALAEAKENALLEGFVSRYGNIPEHTGGLIGSQDRIHMAQTKQNEHDKEQHKKRMLEIQRIEKLNAFNPADADEFKKSTKLSVSEKLAWAARLVGGGYINPDDRVNQALGIGMKTHEPSGLRYNELTQVPEWVEGKKIPSIIGHIETHGKWVLKQSEKAKDYMEIYNELTNNGKTSVLLALEANERGLNATIDMADNTETQTGSMNTSLDSINNTITKTDNIMKANLDMVANNTPYTNPTMQGGYASIYNPSVVSVGGNTVRLNDKGPTGYQTNAESLAAGEGYMFGGIHYASGTGPGPNQGYTPNPNAGQSTSDIYNWLGHPQMGQLYPGWNTMSGDTGYTGAGVSYGQSLTTNAGLAAAQAGTTSPGTTSSTVSSTVSAMISSLKKSSPKAMAAAGFASGGWINEPIFGVGASGQKYTMGEAGPEYITPADQVGGIVANISINIDKIAHDIDLEQIKPIVERALLEVHSRRGII